MTVERIVDELVSLLETVEGLKRVYADPPEAISEFPSAIVYVASGTMEFLATGGHSLHSVVVEIYHGRQVLPQAVDEAKVWPDRIFAALKSDQHLNGAASHIVWPFQYRASALRYGTLVHYGMRFEVTYKVNET